MRRKREFAGPRLDLKPSLPILSPEDRWNLDLADMNDTDEPQAGGYCPDEALASKTEPETMSGSLAEPSEDALHTASDAPAVDEPEAVAPAPAGRAAGRSRSASRRHRPRQNRKTRNSLTETVKTIAYALLIALVIRTFLFQPFNIPSGSMEATLLVGDYLFVEKFAYGYSKNSFPFSPPLFSGRVFASQPHRGDVIVFKMPNASSPDYMKDFIKRCIGLPGDHIQMINGQIYLNDKPVPRVRVQDYVYTDDSGIENRVPQYRETLPGGKTYLCSL